MSDLSTTRRLILAASLLITIALIAWAGRSQSVHSQSLRNLRDHGHHVRATEVQIKEPSRTTRYSAFEQTRAHYRFLRLERHEQPATLPDPPPKDAIQWVRAQAHNDPWVWGHQDISSATADAIRHGDRTVTYLPENPNINAIGPLTDTRISGDWFDNRILAFAVLWLFLSIGLFFIEPRLAKRQRRRAR